MQMKVYWVHMPFPRPPSPAKPFIHLYRGAATCVPENTSLTLFTHHRFTIITTTTKQAYLHSWSGGFSHTQPAALVSHTPPTNHHHHAIQIPLSTHLIHPRQLPFYVSPDPYCYRKTPGECEYIAAKTTGRRVHMLLQMYIGGRGRRTAPQPSDRARSPSSACADRRVTCDV